jgi:hypothetical protein
LLTFLFNLGLDASNLGVENVLKFVRLESFLASIADTKLV